MQLELDFGRPFENEELHWVTGCRPDYSAQPMAQYTIMIRADDDPERKPRPKGGQKDRRPHLTIAKWSIEDIKAKLLEHLSDGEPRTFNRIGIELWDKGGDLLAGTKVEEALWELVEEYEVGCTVRAPIRFVVNLEWRWDHERKEWVER